MPSEKSLSTTMLAISTLVACSLLATPARAQEAAATYRDMQATLGSVPTFFKLGPEEGIGGAWAEFKTVQLNPKSALSGKEKELIGLAVAAQSPCTYCIYFHTAAAKANGATDAEVREAVAMAIVNPCFASSRDRSPRCRAAEAGISRTSSTGTCCI